MIFLFQNVLEIEGRTLKMEDHDEDPNITMGFIRLILELFLPIFTNTLNSKNSALSVIAQNGTMLKSRVNASLVNPEFSRLFEKTKKDFIENNQKINNADTLPAEAPFFKYFADPKDVPSHFEYIRPKKENNYLFLSTYLLTSNILLSQASRCRYSFLEIKKVEEMIKNGERDISDLAVVCVETLRKEWQCRPSLPKDGCLNNPNPFITNSIGSMKKEDMYIPTKHPFFIPTSAMRKPLESLFENKIENPEIILKEPTIKQDTDLNAKQPMIPFFPPFSSHEQNGGTLKRNFLSKFETDDAESYEKERLKNIFSSDILDAAENKFRFNI